MAALAVGLMAIGGALLFIALSTVLNGFALSVIWNWFLPGIFGLPELRVVEAMAIALIVSYLTHQYDDAKKEHEGTEALGHALGVTIIKPLLALGIAWCIKQFL